MIAAAELAAVLPRLPTISCGGTWWRVVNLRHVQGPPPGSPAGSPPQPLWPGGAALKGARYTPRGAFDSLYLAPDAATALAEVNAVLFGAGGVAPGPPHNPLTVVSVSVQVARIVDLGDASVRRALGTTVAELVRPWARAQLRFEQGGGSEPPTQALGRAAFASGTITGLRYPSAKRRRAYTAGSRSMPRTGSPFTIPPGCSPRRFPSARTSRHNADHHRFLCASPTPNCTRVTRSPQRGHEPSYHCCCPISHGAFCLGNSHRRLSDETKGTCYPQPAGDAGSGSMHGNAHGAARAWRQPSSYGRGRKRVGRRKFCSGGNSYGPVGTSIKRYDG